VSGTKFTEQTDVQTQQKLIAYSSSQLIDRDFVNFPRVTDGDFSGGGLQTVFIDPRRYFDSDLEIRTPGYLYLRPGWTRAQKTSITAGANRQIVTLADGSGNPELYVSYGESNGNVYAVHGGGTVTFTSAVVGLDTDGQYLYAGQAGRLERYLPGGGNTAVATALNGTARQWWVVQQGTQGFFAYYAVGTNTLYKIDLTLGYPVAAGSQPLVPIGGGNLNIVDIVPYAANIAILTNDVNGSGCDVWFHDGQNMTRIIRIEGYLARGLANCLGTLYVGAQAIGGYTSPILAKIGAGEFQIVAKPGSPFFTNTAQACLQPRSSSNFVYWPVTTPSISGISGSAGGYVVQYDALTGAVAHLQVQDSTDLGSTAATNTDAGLRVVALVGDAAAIAWVNGTTGTAQYQYTAFGTKTFAPSGWVVSSKLDFNTPSIPKLFKRLIVTHAPLAAGEQVLLQGWVDKDPLKFATGATQGSGASQYTAQNTNSTVGSTQTVLTLPASTIGNSMFYALQLTAGTSNGTSPTVYYISAEIGVPWLWSFTVNCSSQRMDLRGKPDGQGLRGIDLYGLLHDAWENSAPVTFWHPNGNSYTAVMEQAKFDSDSPMYRDSSNQPKDYEAQVTLLLRQSTV
jgi:hypothetical protein